jgi:hypothetical protein
MNPGPILIVRNTFPTHLHALLFLELFKSENTKNIFTFLHTPTKPKNILPHYIYFIASYLLCLHYHHILFYLHLHLVLDNHSVELGTQDKEVVLQVA